MDFLGGLKWLESLIPTCGIKPIPRPALFSHCANPSQHENDRMFRSLTVFGLLLAAYFFLAYDPRVVVKSEGDLRAERQTAIKRLAEDVDSLGKAAVQADIPRGEELLKQRILVRLEAALESRGDKSKFSHYRPARFFAEKLANLKADISSATFERFENAFKALNKLL